eukprot:scaffold1448_cov109-Cylindrotheca_fusiformis.AAC.3
MANGCSNSVKLATSTWPSIYQDCPWRWLERRVPVSGVQSNKIITAIECDQAIFLNVRIGWASSIPCYARKQEVQRGSCVVQSIRRVVLFVGSCDLRVIGTINGAILFILLRCRHSSDSPSSFWFQEMMVAFSSHSRSCYFETTYHGLLEVIEATKSFLSCCTPTISVVLDNDSLQSSVIALYVCLFGCVNESVAKFQHHRFISTEGEDINEGESSIPFSPLYGYRYHANKYLSFVQHRIVWNSRGMGQWGRTLQQPLRVIAQT